MHKDFHETCIFSTDIKKSTPISNFVKIRPVRAEFFHVDRRTDRYMTKLILSFLNVAHMPK